MSILGKPIRVCPQHIEKMGCGCMGVEMQDCQSLKDKFDAHCAVCETVYLQDGWRVRKLLRKCKRRGCYGRYKPSIL